VATLLRFDATDPYAVHAEFQTGGTDVIEWTFARELLSQGVHRRMGEGDVRVWPATNQHIVFLSLSSPSGSALFEVPRAALVDFLRRTYRSVPPGHEGDVIDLDAELALLVWADPHR
jgi:hypothetical protein